MEQMFGILHDRMESVGLYYTVYVIKMDYNKYTEPYDTQDFNPNWITLW
jgi:hypothetical protein